MIGGNHCWVCGSTTDLHTHEIYFGSGNRQISIKNGFQVRLCGVHHNLSDKGVHFDKALDLELKQHCQREYEKDHLRFDFMRLVGRNYLDD